ncbi:4Fe-4S binding protein [Acetobacterium wieringae]|uniref:4Fe-4S binding protein n=1 Tax=Acetobacterium wieringae TaxID=52694 RepID=UPI0026EFB8FC|nr:4Fe-4S binding protein [Acetobacterium wieringae]
MAKPKKFNLRLMVQISFFALIALISVNKTLATAGMGIPFLSAASLHALCPFGGVETFFSLITAGFFVPKTQITSVILMSLVFLLALLFGPVFCGWICPFGAFQEWIGKIGKKIFKKRYNQFILPKVDKLLRYLRYGVLVWVLTVTAVSGTLLFANLDPYHALFKFWTGTVALPALILLGVITIGSLFVARPWCKYACPYGALLGLFNTIRIFKIRRKTATCVNCQKCSRSCPMNIDVCRTETVTNLSCISCYECTSNRNCPKSETLVVQATKQSSHISITVVAIVMLTVFIGGIFGTITLDIWDLKTNEPGSGGKNNGGGQKHQVEMQEAVQITISD